MQAAYEQSGGRDPGLLAQMTDLQMEAQGLEQRLLEAKGSRRRRSESLTPSSWFQGLLAALWGRCVAVGDHILINVIADRIRIRITLLIPETGHL